MTMLRVEEEPPFAFGESMNMVIVIFKFKEILLRVGRGFVDV